MEPIHLQFVRSGNYEINTNYPSICSQSGPLSNLRTQHGPQVWMSSAANHFSERFISFICCDLPNCFRLIADLLRSIFHYLVGGNKCWTSGDGFAAATFQGCEVILTFLNCIHSALKNFSYSVLGQ